MGLAWPGWQVAVLSQRESRGAVPLAIIIRPKITAATAVAARTVKNQNSRLPLRTKGRALLGRSGGVGPPANCGRDEAEAVADLWGRAPRRWGEIQGKTARTRRFLRTPDRPYSTSTTTVSRASSLKPIMMSPLLLVDVIAFVRPSAATQASGRLRPCEVPARRARWRLPAQKHGTVATRAKPSESATRRGNTPSGRR